MYIEVQQMVEDAVEFGPIDGNRVIQRLFHALGQTLRQNDNLRAQVASTRDLLDEKDIELFNQGIELFNATGNLEFLTEPEAK